MKFFRGTDWVHIHLSSTNANIGYTNWGQMNVTHKTNSNRTTTEIQIHFEINIFIHGLKPYIPFLKLQFASRINLIGSNTTKLELNKLSAWYLNTQLNVNAIICWIVRKWRQQWSESNRTFVRFKSHVVISSVPKQWHSLTLCTTSGIRWSCCIVFVTSGFL